MGVSLQRQTTTVTLPDPLPGYPVRAAHRQAVGRTAGGAVYVYDKGVKTFEVELHFESLSQSEKEALAAFFKDTAEGCLQTFTYSDSNGTARTARFLEPRLEFTKVAPSVWDVRFRLEINSIGS